MVIIMAITPVKNQSYKQVRVLQHSSPLINTLARVIIEEEIYMLGFLISIFLFVMIIIGVLSLIALDWTELYRFEFGIKKYLQHNDLVEKDIDYVNYMRDVYVPKEKLANRLANIEIANRAVRAKIFEAMIKEKDTVEIVYGQWGDFSDCKNMDRDERVAVVKAIVEELKLEVEKGEFDYDYPCTCRIKLK